MPLRLALRTIVPVEKVKRRPQERSLPELGRMADRLGRVRRSRNARDALADLTAPKRRLSVLNQ